MPGGETAVLGENGGSHFNESKTPAFPDGEAEKAKLSLEDTPKSERKKNKEKRKSSKKKDADGTTGDITGQSSEEKVANGKQENEKSPGKEERRKIQSRSNSSDPAIDPTTNLTSKEEKKDELYTFNKKENSNRLSKRLSGAFNISREDFGRSKHSDVETKTDENGVTTVTFAHSASPKKSRRKLTERGTSFAESGDEATERARAKSKPKPVLEHKRNLVGEIIYKKHPSWILMQNIQTGIRHSVGKSSALSYEDELESIKHSIQKNEEFFKSAKALRFPPEGSAETQPHKTGLFKFKDYCPLAFRHLREKFCIDPGDYMVSLCNTLDDGLNALRELPTPGKSGSLFFFSHDMRYILKTIPKREAKLLRYLLPSYYQHVMENSNTLLPKFFGLHRVKPHKGSQVRFVVMGNVFATNKKIHERFDLKGSTFGRAVTDEEVKSLHENVTYKDVDWRTRGKKLTLGTEMKNLFLDQLHKDCQFLESMNIMDYSLLVGIHNCSTNDGKDCSYYCELKRDFPEEYYKSINMTTPVLHTTTTTTTNGGGQPQNDHSVVTSEKDSIEMSDVKPVLVLEEEMPIVPHNLQVHPPHHDHRDDHHHHDHPNNNTNNNNNGANPLETVVESTTTVTEGSASNTITIIDNNNNNNAISDNNNTNNTPPVVIVEQRAEETTTIVTTKERSLTDPDSPRVTINGNHPNNNNSNNNTTNGTSGNNNNNNNTLSPSASTTVVEKTMVKSMSLQPPSPRGNGTTTTTTTNRWTLRKKSTNNEGAQRMANGIYSTLRRNPTSTEPKTIAQTNFPLPEHYQSPISIFQRDDGGMTGVDRNIHYFVAVIDILMLYTIRKKMEHTYKSVLYKASADEISSVEPVTYSHRFQDFITEITE